MKWSAARRRRSVVPSPRRPGGQAGHGGGVGVLAVEGAAFEVVVDLGCDDLQHLAAQGAQPGGPEPGGLVGEVVLGPALYVGRDVVGQGVEGPGDHDGAGPVEPAGAHRGGQSRAALERPGIGQVASCGVVVEPYLVGQPGAGVAGAVLERDVVGRGQDAQAELVEAGRGRCEPDQGLLLVGGGHEQRVDVYDAVQGRGQVVGAGQHRMTVQGR
jgi:hypothetical protein